MKHIDVYPCLPPRFREHPGYPLSASEVFAAIREYAARAEETACYYDEAKLHRNGERCWFLAQAAKRLAAQRELFFAKQDALQTVQTKVAA